MRWGLIILFLGIGFGSRAFPQSRSLSDAQLISKFTQHCGSCHRTGAYRFLFDAMSAEANIQYLLDTGSPLTTSAWAQSIIDVLDWPGGAIPSNYDRVDDNRRYMPFGSQKYVFAGETQGSESLRMAIMSALRDRMGR